MNCESNSGRKSVKLARRLMAKSQTSIVGESNNLMER
jgi:hypothetical protein